MEVSIPSLPPFPRFLRHLKKKDKEGEQHPTSEVTWGSRIPVVSYLGCTKVIPHMHSHAPGSEVHQAPPESQPEEGRRRKRRKLAGHLTGEQPSNHLHRGRNFAPGRAPRICPTLRVREDLRPKKRRGPWRPGCAPWLRPGGQGTGVRSQGSARAGAQRATARGVQKLHPFSPCPSRRPWPEPALPEPEMWTRSGRPRLEQEDRSLWDRPRGLGSPGSRRWAGASGSPGGSPGFRLAAAMGLGLAPRLGAGRAVGGRLQEETEKFAQEGAAYSLGSKSFRAGSSGGPRCPPTCPGAPPPPPLPHPLPESGHCPAQGGDNARPEDPPLGFGCKVMGSSGAFSGALGRCHLCICTRESGGCSRQGHAQCAQKERKQGCKNDTSFADPGTL